MKRYIYLSLLFICMASHAMQDSEKKNLEKDKRRFSLPSLPKLLSSSKDEGSGSNLKSPRMTKNSLNDRSSSDGAMHPHVFFDLQSNGTRAIHPDPEEKEGCMLSPRSQSSHVSRVSLRTVQEIVERTSSPPPERKKSASNVYYVDTDIAGSSSSSTVDVSRDSNRGTVFNDGSLDESIAMVMAGMKVKKQDGKE